jgi:uncharacterized protein YceK
MGMGERMNKILIAILAAIILAGCGTSVKHTNEAAVRIKGNNTPEILIMPRIPRTNF